MKKIILLWVALFFLFMNAKSLSAYNVGCIPENWEVWEYYQCHGTTWVEGGIRVTWTASCEGSIDHYIVYRYERAVDGSGNCAPVPEPWHCESNSDPDCTTKPEQNGWQRLNNIVPRKQDGQERHEYEYIDYNIQANKCYSYCLIPETKGGVWIVEWSQDFHNCKVIPGPSMGTGYKVWIDKNGSGGYEANSGEEVEGARVTLLVSNPISGETDSQGIIRFQTLQKDDTKLYAYKELYSVPSPKADDNNFGGRANNPYYAGNGKLDGKMYSFVMASDELDEITGEYFDFPGEGNTLKNAKKDTDGNILIQLVHPKIEWNIVIAFQDRPSTEFFDQLYVGLRDFSNYVYNYTDGYSLIRNAVIVQGAFEGTSQWNYCDIQIKNETRPCSDNNGIKNKDAYIWMPKKTFEADPDMHGWSASLGHEMGHYAFGFFDEYLNGDRSKNYKGEPYWSYRVEHQEGYEPYGTPEGYIAPNEFPKNYGIMDSQWYSHELSDIHDYFPRLFPLIDVDLATAQYNLTSGKSCWEYFKSSITQDIKNGMEAAGLTGFDETFYNNLIKLPDTTGSYPPSGPKRQGPRKPNHNKTRIIPWSPTSPSPDIRGLSALSSSQTRQAVPSSPLIPAAITVVDETAAPVTGAQIWLVDGARKSFQGTTDTSGMLRNLGLKDGQTIEVYCAGHRTTVTLEKAAPENVITLLVHTAYEKALAQFNAFSHFTAKGAYQQGMPGIIVSARPDATDSTLDIVVSGDTLDMPPIVTLAQPTGFSQRVIMTPSMTNAYSGESSYEYTSGSLEVSAQAGGITNSSLNRFVIQQTNAGEQNMYYSSTGSLQLSFFSSDSFSGSGKFIIIDSSAPAPANQDLVQVGNIYSIGFSEAIGTVRDVSMSISYSLQDIQGLDSSQVQLYGWNRAGNAWELISGGGSGLKSFGIILLSIDYESYGLFAPASSDTIPPEPVTDLQATTGDALWSVKLQWTAPADDGNKPAFAYDLRYNTVPISGDTWEKCSQIDSVPKPAAPGVAQGMIIPMPDPGANYYFGIKVIDAAGNVSALGTQGTPAMSQMIDNDHDGMSDDWERAHGLNPYFDDSQYDYDGDGLSNIEEYRLGTDPWDSDTNRNGIYDDEDPCPDCSLVIEGETNTPRRLFWEVYAGWSINEAVAQVSSGGTVLVHDGVYNEDIDFMGKAINIRSINGPESTIINGAGLNPSIVQFINGETSSSVLEGFTVRNGNPANSGSLIYCQGSSPTIVNCIIAGQTSSQNGGGIYCSSSSPTITSCTISGNTAPLGAGIYCSESSPVISKSRITNNEATTGGGMYCDNFSNPAITNSIIAGNVASENGGGMYCSDDSTPKLVNCTIFGNNAAASGGGIYKGNSSLLITNCIMWNNAALYFPQIEMGGAAATMLYSAIDQDGFGNPDGSADASGNIRQEPQFTAPLGGDFQLNAGSPCIDSGTEAEAPAADMLGVPRPQGPGVDMGPYETFGSSGSKTWFVFPYQSIQHFINLAADGDTVLVQDGKYNEANLSFYGKKITVKSVNGPAHTIIDGLGLDASIVKFINGETGASVLDGFTIRNGAAANGGGIYCANATPTIRNCVFSSNTASEKGGAIYCDNSPLTISGFTFAGNRAGTQGGAIYCANNSLLTINNCIFSGNSAETEGGAMYCSNDSPPTLTGCMIAGNNAASGGGIYLGYGTIAKCIISNNSASQNGGGLYGYGLFTNCILSGNNASQNGGGLYGYGRFTNCTISGNTAINNGGGVYQWNSPLRITNCILWNNAALTYSQVEIKTTYPAEVQYSNIDQDGFGNPDGSADANGNIRHDPQFTNPTDRNFQLNTESPCIDSGTALGAPAADMLGTLRPQGPGFDMGAYEYVPAAGSSSTSTSSSTTTTVPAIAAALQPQTGQKKCYSQTGAEIACAGTGQDGEIQAGAVWPEPRFNDHGDGTVTDNLTGLMWTKDANLPGAQNIDNSLKTWTEALDFVAGMNSGSGTCGYTDWRLPNVRELESLENADVPDTAYWLTAQGFKNVLTGYWSSTTYVSYLSVTDEALCIKMHSSNYLVEAFSKSGESGVWAVRTGQSGSVINLPQTGQKLSYHAGDDGALRKGVAWPNPRFTDHGDGTVTDNINGLMWTKNTRPAEARTWQDALNYVAVINSGSGLYGYTDWHLPNRDELNSLIDYSRACCAFLPSGHPFTNIIMSNSGSDWYWSSTSAAASPDGAWGFTPYYGSIQYGSNNKVNACYIWPVRSAHTQQAAVANLAISKSGDGAGVVSSDPDGINCGLTCSATFSINQVVTLTAMPEPGSIFTGWSGACSGTGDCVITMTARNYTVNAEFQQVSKTTSILLPQTGQKKCYSQTGAEIACAGTGQDGDIRAGVAWPETRFTDHGDGTVTDNLTGLMWTKNANLPGATKTWTQALDYVTGMNSYSGTYGYTDWRLPNFNELESLANLGVTNFAAWLTAQGFTNISSQYWSSTTYISNDSGYTGYALDMVMSNCQGEAKMKTSSLGVWAVRTADGPRVINLARTGQTVSYYAGDDGALRKGVEWPSPRFTDHGDGTVIDNLTDLMWTKEANPAGAKTWQNALTYVAGINSGSGTYGYTDWRLPNRDELRSLFDCTEYNLVLPVGHPFINVVANWYWTSTSAAATPSGVWGFNPVTGGTSYSSGNKASSYYTWPVRSAHTQQAAVANLVITKSGGGAGIVTSDPDGISCGLTCSATFSMNQVATLTAMPQPGSIFTGWSGPCSGMGDCVVTMNDSKYVNAGFQQIPQTTSTTESTSSIPSTSTGPATTSSSTTSVAPVSAAPAQLPKTGQKRCYGLAGFEIDCAGTGQDGETQAGVVWPEPRFTDHGDGTITDTLTGLMWTQNANLPGANKTWLLALDFVAGMNGGSGTYGYTDWRLPNIRELESLANVSEADYTQWLTSQGFTNLLSKYWSSTTYYDNWIPDKTSQALCMNMADCYSNATVKTSATGVWAVRAGQGGVLSLPKTGQKISYYAGDDGALQKGEAWPYPRFTDNNDGTVTDNLTGRMWTKDANLTLAESTVNVGAVTWRTALNYVVGMNSGNGTFGYTDWRLPNRVELKSLIDHSHSYPVIPSGHPFINYRNGWYWSSTSAAVLPSGVWAFHSYYGEITYDANNKVDNAFTWAVRSIQPESVTSSIFSTSTTTTTAGPETAAILLPQTGQKKCYTAAGAEIDCIGTGQDGEIQAGAAWPEPRFIDHGDGTITDNLTGLMWTKNANLPWEIKTWTQALDYVTGMNSGSGTFGYTDWRLPNIRELESLANVGKADYVQWLTSQGFTRVLANYWSSTTFGSNALNMRTSDCFVTSAAKTSVYGVWAVRTGQSGSVISLPQTGQKVSYYAGDDGALQKGAAWPNPRFTDHGDGTVTDHLTGLMWTRNASMPGIKTWQEALNYVAGMNSGMYCSFNYKGWRLPNRDELRSLKDYSKTSYVLPSEHPFTYSSVYYWSSTSAAGYLSGAWGFNPYTGVITYDSGNKSESCYVWPVRDVQQGTLTSSTSSIPLPQTGQKTCYDSDGTEVFCPGTGQDGETQAGTVWPEPRFINHRDGTITDNLTGLMWTKNANRPGATKPWTEALDYVEGMNSNSGTYGYTDWRLPNINELESLANQEHPYLAVWLNMQGFINVLPKYWSSTTSPCKTDQAVNMLTSSSQAVATYKSDSCGVWAVRTGESRGVISLPWTGQNTSYYAGDDGCLQKGVKLPTPRFTDHGDGTVTDKLTGLMWTKETNLIGRVTWQEALDYAAGLNSGKYEFVKFTDWRLPTRDELRSMIDYSMCAIDPYGDLPFGHPFNLIIYSTPCDGCYYWSSTSIAGFPGYAWVLKPYTWDNLTYGMKSHTYHLWLVRSIEPESLAELNISKSGDGAGVVSSDPSGIDCGSTCSAVFNKNQKVTLTAMPEPGSIFLGWSGSCSGTGDCVVIMNASKYVNAGFQQIAQTTSTTEPAGTTTSIESTSSISSTSITPTTSSSTTSIAPVTAAALLPQTGQKKCYTAAGAEIDCAGTGQDGETQAGVAWPETRFTDHGDGTVTDTLTGLMWTQNANLAGATKNWTQAFDYVASMNSGSGTFGYTDWRLPNIRELESLANVGEANYVQWLNSQGFTNVLEKYWSSTTYRDIAQPVGSVALNMSTFGTRVCYVESYNKSTGLFGVWAVRTGQSGSVVNLPKTGQTVSYYAGDDGALQKGVAWPSPRFTDHGDGLVTDKLTGLMWTKNANPAGLMTWQNALNYVAGMNSGSGTYGYTDWRLPNRDELKSFFDYSKSYPVIPIGHPFTNYVGGWYWSSTSAALLPSGAWAFHSYYGTIRYDSGNKSSTAYTWPVRSAQTQQASVAKLVVSKSGDGAGTVSSNPAIINCGSTCGAVFSISQVVTLTAVPDTGSTFTGWSDSCSGTGECVVTMNASKFVTAGFQQGPQTTSTTESTSSTTSELTTSTTSIEPTTTSSSTTTSEAVSTTTSVPPTTTVSTTTIPEVFTVFPQQFNVSLYKGGTKDKTLTLSNQTSSALGFEITYPALVTLITDPAGDVNPGTSAKPVVDITRVDAGFNWNMKWMRLQITFNGPVIPELLGYIYLDTDQNPATGLAGMKKYYGAGVLGYEYLLNYFSAGSEGIVVVEDGSGAKGPVMLSGFYSNNDTVFTVDVPLSTIGKADGNMNLGMLLGNTALKMDIAPDTTKAVLAGQGTFILWLTISQTSGTVNAHENLPLILGFDTAQIKEGIYTDHLTLQTSGSLVTEITVPITLKVYKDGQHIIEGHVSGTVKSGVTINLYDVGGCSEILVSTTITDENGDYGFFDLADGDYKVEASKSGYTFTPGYYNVSIPRVNQDYLDFIAN